MSCARFPSDEWCACTANAKHQPVPVDVLCRPSRFVGTSDTAEAAAVLDAVAAPILASMEDAALGKMARMRAELCEWARQQAVESSALSALHAVQFEMVSKAPRLQFVPEISFVKALRVARSGAVGMVQSKRL